MEIHSEWGYFSTLSSGKYKYFSNSCYVRTMCFSLNNRNYILVLMSHHGSRVNKIYSEQEANAVDFVQHLVRLIIALLKNNICESWWDKSILGLILNFVNKLLNLWNSSSAFPLCISFF